MSNFKKFLALVLATLMVASMMVISAPAASAYAPTGDYADDIALLNAFGVMLGDGVSFGEKENVTRWQMALFIARIVTGETGNDMWEAEKSEFFTDVTADHYPGAIDFCAEMGYIKGVGDNKFEPDENITYQDGLVMLVRLLGYETENMTYPWGYILAARTISTIKSTDENKDLLVGDINTSNKTPLLREEVANLLAKALYVEILNAKGENTKVTYIQSGLKATDLGKGTLVATWNASIDGTDFSGDYNKVSFKVGTEIVKVKIANVSNLNLELNDYLGFTADLVDVKGVQFANMNNVKVFDASVTSENKIKVDGKEFTSFLVYGADTHHVFTTVADAAAYFTANGKNGKVVLCDTENNGTKVEDDIIRYIPYNDARAVYPQTVSVTKASGAWPATESIVVYYVAKYDSNVKRLVANVLPAGAAKNSTEHELAKMYGIGDAGLSGTLYANGISNNGTSVTEPVRTTISKDGWNRRDTTSLFVHVIGDIVYGEPMVCSIVNIPSDETTSAGDQDADKDLTFVTVGKTLEIETGRGVITEIGNGQLKIGDTFIPAGFALANKKITGTKSATLNAFDTDWYQTFAEAETLVADTTNPLIGKEVNYTKVDGKIVALQKYVETEDEETIYLPNPNTAAPLFIYVDAETEYKVAADGTIEIEVFDAKTLTTSTIKFDQINGKKVGTLVNQFGFEVAAGIVGYAGAEDLTELVIAMIVDNNNYVFDYTATDAENALVLVTVANKADDVYALTTDKNAYVEKVVLGANVHKKSDGTVISGEDTDGTKNLGFVTYTGSALTNAPYYVGTYDAKSTTVAKYTFAPKYLTITDSTVINVIAADGIKSFKNITVTEGDFLKLVDSGNAFVLNLTNDLVVIVNADANLADIAQFGSNLTVPTTGGWYTLTWTSQYVSTTAETINGVTYFNYTFKDLYNLTTGAKETVTISSRNYYSVAGDFADSPAAKFFADSWKGTSATGLNIDPTNKALVEQSGSKKGTLVDTVTLDLYDVYYISDAKGSETVESSIISWGLANGYSFAQVKTAGIVSGDANTFMADKLDVTCTEDGKFTLTRNGELTSVVAINSTVLNQSKDSTADEFKVVDGTPGAHAAKLATQKEVVAYKLGKDGVITVFGITADDFKSHTGASFTIADALAEAAE